MKAERVEVLEAAFDTVGKYNQDQINGFDAVLLDTLIELLSPHEAKAVLDLMGGDGNLTKRIYSYAQKRGLSINPITMLEYSRVQSEFARMELSNTNAHVIWGDALAMRTLDSKESLADASFDRVVIKSANHEIPQARQLELYKSIYRVLETGGTFVNLGFLFDSTEERDEMRAIAHCKDSLAGMKEAVLNRHFLVRSEFYQMLEEAGFTDIQSGASFNYHIHSSVVAEQYFKVKERNEFDTAFQVSQARARTMRKNGRIIFDHDTSLMKCPGEITIAKKPSHSDRSRKIFKQYPYDFVRSIKTHQQMLKSTCNHLPSQGKLLDLGCGIGLLAECLRSSPIQYRGVDLNKEFIEICNSRFNDSSSIGFEVADINTIALEQNHYDAICALNSLYCEGVNVPVVLEKCYHALAKNGTMIVSGPFSRESYQRAEPHIIAQLEKDGLRKGNQDILDQIRVANERLLSAHANYYSVEGLVELLRKVGFSEFVACEANHYYGNAYLIAAKK